MAMRITPTASDPNASITVDGVAVTSGTASQSITLSSDTTLVDVVITAQDGVTQKTHALYIYKNAAPSDYAVYIPVSLAKPMQGTPGGNKIVVHQAVSPNGDGINDVLIIDGISNYPDNKLMILNRDGSLVCEITGYNNTSRVFDGHSSKTRQMQSPGTYFYELDYKVKGVTKHKTGFIVLKY